MNTIIWCKDDEAAGAAASAAPERYERNLKRLWRIAFVTSVTEVFSWFLGFCALTWASAVLVGAYVTELSVWRFWGVFLLLFFEGLRFGIAALVRMLGYHLISRLFGHGLIGDVCRWTLRSLASSLLPFFMGGVAVLSFVPPEIIDTIGNLLGGQPIDHSQHIRHLRPSLNIFYALVIANALIIIVGSSITELMRRRYIHSNDNSLSYYHDKMLETTNSWLRPAIDLHFAFSIMGSRYEELDDARSKNSDDASSLFKELDDARSVCKEFSDMIKYLYMNPKGVEAAEAALAAEDRYVRLAAANIVGFWAVLEKMEFEEKQRLCFQRGMLSKLADIAAESYGSLGAAAARSFEVLFELVNEEWIGMLACVRSKSTGQDLIDILLSRAAELLHPPCPQEYICKLPSSLQKESNAHMNALRQYLLRLRRNSDVGRAVADFMKDEQAKLEQKMDKAVKKGKAKWSSCTLQSLHDLLPPTTTEKASDGYIISISRQGECTNTAHRHSLLRAMLINAGVLLVCLGVGFGVGLILALVIPS